MGEDTGDRRSCSHAVDMLDSFPFPVFSLLLGLKKARSEEELSLSLSLSPGGRNLFFRPLLSFFLSLSILSSSLSGNEELEWSALYPG